MRTLIKSRKSLGTIAAMGFAAAGIALDLPVFLALGLTLLCGVTLSLVLVASRTRVETSDLLRKANSIDARIAEIGSQAKNHSDRLETLDAGLSQLANSLEAQTEALQRSANQVYDFENNRFPGVLSALEGHRRRIDEIVTRLEEAEHRLRPTPIHKNGPRWELKASGEVARLRREIVQDD